MKTLEQKKQANKITVQKLQDKDGSYLAFTVESVIKSKHYNYYFDRTFACEIYEAINRDFSSFNCDVFAYAWNNIVANWSNITKKKVTIYGNEI